MRYCAAILLFLFGCSGELPTPCGTIPAVVDDLSLGNYAYAMAGPFVGLYYDGIRTLNANREVIGRYEAADMQGVQDVQQFGEVLAVSAYESGKYILLTATPTPQRIAEVAANGPAGCYYDSGYWYFLHYDTNELSIYDEALQHISTTRIERFKSPAGIWVSGGVAVVLGYDSDSVVRMDVSNPERPVVTGRIANFGPGIGVLNGAYAVQVRDGVAYVSAYYSDYLTSIDLETFSVIDTVRTLNGPAYFSLVGNMAYVATTQGVAVVDVCDPAAMEVVDIQGAGVYADVGRIETKLLGLKYNAQ